jgi:capsular exopolysaccharide synthesis family protein
LQKAVQPIDTILRAQSEGESDSRIDLFSAFRTLWLGKFWIGLFVLVAISYGWYKAYVASTPIFMAQTQMALELAQPSALDIQAVVSGFQGDQAGINTEMAIVTSGEIIGQLVDELRLDQDPEFNPYLPNPDDEPGLLGQALGAAEDAIRGLLDIPEPAPEQPTPEEIRIKLIDNVRDVFQTESNWNTYVFTIFATSQNPDKSALLANTLGRLYSEDKMRNKIQAAERMAAWLSERVGELRPELEIRQQEIADLRARSALVSDLSVQAINAQAIELRSTLGTAENQLARIDRRLDSLRAAERSGDLDARLAAAQDGQLTAAADALSAGEAGARLRFDRRFAQLLQQTEAERIRAQQAVNELQSQADALTTQFESQASDLLKLQQLEQDAQATQVLYETFLTRLKEASVQSTVYESSTRLLTAATPGVQIAPRPMAILSISLALGLILGSAFVLGREFLQSTFRTAEDLERHTGRPVVGQVPLIPARNRPDTIRYLQTKPTSAAAEAVRNLRTSILLSDIDSPPQVVMMTSSVPSEGKTTVSISLALNLAGLDKKVLLIEGDIRRCTLDAYFGGTRRSGGILSVVTGKQTLAEAVVQPEGTNIDVLMGEKSSVNAADVFSSGSFRRMLEEARRTYDYVIVDTPPVLVVPDARVIAQYVDSVIYVVHWDNTTKSQVENGVRQFRSVNVNVDGLVLSKINPKGMKRYGYGARYGAYAAYGGSYYNN